MEIFNVLSKRKNVMKVDKCKNRNQIISDKNGKFHRKIIEIGI